MSGRRVDEIMTRNVVVATPEMPISKVVTLMEKHSARRLPVSLNGKVVGVISRLNIVRVLARELSDETEASQDDRAITKSIREQMNGAAWGPLPDVYITVRKGVATLSGVITDVRV